MIGGKIRVLIVDDSAIVRKVLSDCLSGEPDIEVAGTAPDPYIARDKIVALKPDVVTLDIEMPRMDGLTFLKRLMHYHPMPVIIISSLAQPSCHIALDALRTGAIEVMAKPGGPYSVGELQQQLAHKIRAAAASRLRRPGAASSQPLAPGAVPGARAADKAGVPLRATPGSMQSIIAIGASTGGTEAIQAVLTQLPAECPAIVVTQHIPAGFSLAFAKRLNEICRMEVKEAQDGDALAPGRALVAPGNFHMLLRGAPGSYRVAVKTGPPVCYQRPAVDVLFASVAEAAGGKALGVLLTGMGADGAQGLLKMKQAGARTIAQDEATSVVYGMPREAVRLGAADRVLPLDRIAAAILA